LSDTLGVAREAARLCDATLRVVHDPSHPSPVFLSLLGDVIGTPQVDGDLGQRLAAGLGSDAAPRVALGSDAPDLPVEQVVAALSGLEPESARISPAPDGGYVLLALGAGVDAGCLREGIAWSSENTAAQTLAALETGGARLLPPLPGWPDVDELADLHALQRRLRNNPQAAPATRAWLEEHAESIRL
jgi:glycosyltransferase A (GT-A) superfamily protein (DUF2064 family)